MESVMRGKLLKPCALTVLLALPLGACMSNAPSNQYQAQYFNDLRPCPPETHSQSSPFGMGYSCVLNP
jgi:hypothetical protein